MGGNKVVKTIQNFEPMTRSALIRERLFECIHKGEIDNVDMVQIISHISTILNLQTLTTYAQRQNISYNGAKKRQSPTMTIAGQTFIIDNE